MADRDDLPELLRELAQYQFDKGTLAAWRAMEEAAAEIVSLREQLQAATKALKEAREDTEHWAARSPSSHFVWKYSDAYPRQGAAIASLAEEEPTP